MALAYTTELTLATPQASPPSPYGIGRRSLRCRPPEQSHHRFGVPNSVGTYGN
ncbi:MAG: hypothetical protein IGR93_17465 [Hydrococcus sp. C42_A2020_068]|uniref:hypothetical protein n=1 Tax=Pleurocapsa sp. PCC 7327 TaxID=118163 RepID=UPI0016411D48|nr:hypothetical protein [Pleurocapsa sp. PCC 7327]MBF2021828.1 hypothetical protein [Hydrococcus sp. C42_A2020_068]